MLMQSPEAFLSAVPRLGSLLGLDPGTKTIGVAVSDPMRGHASPLETIQRTKFALDSEIIEKLIDKRQIVGIVVGMPINMSGEAGPRAQSVRAFSRNLEDLVPLPFMYWDERLSTAAVERAMIEADLSRAKRAARVDALAAAHILQGALDRLAVLEDERLNEDG